MNNFAERLKSARTLKGFSLQDLSNAIGKRISRQALHKYEQGETMPDSEKLSWLATALDVRPDFFFQSSSIELGELNFRKFGLPAKEEARIVELIKDQLSRYLELEQIIGLTEMYQTPLKGFRKVSTFEQIDKAAEKVREVWQLGINPLPNVIEMLEDKHIKVVMLEAGDAFEGMQTKVKNNIPIIAINTSRVKKDDRKRFTAMHELAHLILPFDETLTEKQIETLCNQFAAAILFPEEAIKRELGKSRSKLMMQELGALKQEYGISIQAIVMRARDLGIISDHYCKQFFFFIRQMGWKVEEPVEYIGNEQSQRFQQLLFRALAEELISVGKAAALNNQTLSQFRNTHLMAL